MKPLLALLALVASIAGITPPTSAQTLPNTPPMQPTMCGVIRDTVGGAWRYRWTQDIPGVMYTTVIPSGWLDSGWHTGADGRTLHYCTRASVSPFVSTCSGTGVGAWIDITHAVRPQSGGSTWYARCVNSGNEIDVMHYSDALIQMSLNQIDMHLTGTPVAQVTRDRTVHPGGWERGIASGEIARVPYDSYAPWSSRLPHPQRAVALVETCASEVWDPMTEQWVCSQWQVNNWGGPALSDSLFFAFRYDAATGVGGNRATTHRVRFSRTGCMLTVHPTSGDRSTDGRYRWWLVDWGPVAVSLCV
jgi:hypothetical protein